MFIHVYRITGNGNHFLAMPQTTEQLERLPFILMYKASCIGNYNLVTPKTTAKLA